IIGMIMTIQIMEQFGGAALRIPRNIASNCRTKNIFGEAINHKLVEDLGGSEVYIPSQNRIDTALRNKEIIHFHNNGYSLTELALRFNLSRRHIINVLGKSSLKSNNKCNAAL
ncbi:MAG: Mor transcription activator family protein, partial [Thiotrichaceae bacterium]